MHEPTATGERTVQWILAVAGLFVLAHAFIPLREFIHRADDAFYYFETVYNYPATGFWSFDSIHTTNGVQPLWAVLLTAVAQIMAWVGLRDPDLFARCVVGLTGLFHLGSCLLLFRLLVRQVSLGVGTAVAAAFLLPMGIVWQRVWGMENSLYAFCLVATLSYYQVSFRGQETSGRAVVLGLLFGLTALSRLNAVLFAVCAVGALVIAGGRLTFLERIKYGSIIAAVSASCVIPYLLGNYLSTGHPLPISGAVKTMLTEQFMQDHGLESRFSRSFVNVVLTKYQEALGGFFSSRIADGSAILGGRILFGEQLPTSTKFFALLGLVSVLPLVFGPPKAWLAELKAAFTRLQPFWFVLAYAFVNFIVSVVSYPHQIGYAMTKWWLVENEIVIVVLACTVVGTAVAHLGTRLLVPDVRRRVVAVGLALLVALHGRQMVQFYWDGEFQIRDWNRSWNEESLMAAQWLSKHVPEDAIVGSWNAGVIGYYARQRVTNLDGLINNSELLPYLRDRNVGAYITKKNISYLSDMESIFTYYKIHDQLTLREVYRHPNRLMNQDYRIYKIER